MKINREYKYFVVDTCDWLIVSGWEYKEDALDHLDELLEGTSTAVTGDYKIYTARYLNSKDINPFNSDNWVTNDYDCGVCEDTGKKESFDLMSMKESIEDCPDCKTYQYKVTMEEVKYCTYLVDAKSEDDIRDNMNPEIDGKHIFTKPKSDEIIDIVPCVKVDLSGGDNNPDLNKYDSRLDDLLKEKFSLHEVNDIVDMIQQFSGYTKYLSKTDINTEDDFRDFLKIYLKH